MMENKTVLITGTSSGYGKAIAKVFAKRGWNVIATMRSPEKETELTTISNVLITRLDVQDLDSIRDSIKEGIDRFGKIDVLINNAAHGLVGVFESITSEQIRHQFAVNVFGYMDVIREILPYFRTQGGGMIVNIGSQGGIITFPLMSPYHATKFAIEGFTESLSYELASINIIVKLIEPGGADTGFFKNADTSSIPVPREYELIANHTGMDKLFEEYKDKLTTPEEAGLFVYHAVTDGTDNFRYLVGDEMKTFLNIKKQRSDEEYVHLMRDQLLPK
ncbi:SDR family oxidoreductase [Mucilaginibacter aquariorum]|uniref:SDR family oxidoreductase n=1 Tax=Mucilaginibacter aquariorum TaxID=2967225 RepID=A0ABT1SXV4_9SPHI|nr:SDR family oxidoreductase [Mucilaginibacter aquariorum]MCQ6957035.1 SDR family oxidoreductase [Mucilaginibacter aquariorum]